MIVMKDTVLVLVCLALTLGVQLTSGEPQPTVFHTIQSSSLAFF